MSSPRQKQDLIRQLEQLQDYAHKQNWKIVKIYKDIGSGLNDQRAGLLRLIRDLPVLQPTYLLCTYPDRLARFGTTVIKTLCNIFSVDVCITEPLQTTQPVQEQLVQDVLALIYSFAGK